jgi:hypothetical protein
MDITRSAILAASVFIAGCATSKTVGVPAGGAMPPGHLNCRTGCNTIPRFYSGVAYNYCFAVNAKRRDPLMYNSIEQSAYLLDTVASGIVDTLVLPYTVYSQVKKGNIQFRVGEQ